MTQNTSRTYGRLGDRTLTTTSGVTESTVAADFGVLVAQGSIRGYTHFRKFGYNPDVDTTTDPEDVTYIGGLYAGFLSAAEVIDLVSSSTDDASAGIGARTVYIEGLDSNYAVQSETVTLNGTTQVSTSNSYLRVYRAYVATAGSSETNVGDIVGDGTTSSNVVLTIGADLGQTMLGIYTVPADKTLFVKRVRMSSGKQSSAYASWALQIKEENGAWRSRIIDNVNTQGSSNIEIPTLLEIPEKSDIRVRILEVSANNMAFSAVIEGYLISS